jgi:hypothetical protein
VIGKLGVKGFGSFTRLSSTAFGSTLWLQLMAPDSGGLLPRGITVRA